jgi:hypothetical protein
MAYIFDEWKAILDNFQQSVEKDLEEIHQQKAEVQQIKTDIFNQMNSGVFYHDPERIVISAPEIIIGHVDKSGTLQGGMGKVIIKGSEVALEGVGPTGQIINRAPSISQLAVDPGIDGMENVVCDTSQIVSQACDITLHSSDAKDAFSQSPVPAGKGGIRIHADQEMNLEATISAADRKSQIEATVKGLGEDSKNLKKQVDIQKKSVETCLKQMTDLLDEEAKLNQSENYLGRVSVRDIELIHEQMDAVMPALYQATKSFIHLVSQLAEVNRKKKALETEKGLIKTGDDFKMKTTGASLSVKAESISVATVDGDGNTHTNQEAGIVVRTPRLGVSMKDDNGKLVEDGGFSVNAQNISLVTTNFSDDGKELPETGKVNIQSKEINLEAIDYQADDKGVKEKELTKDGKITMTAKTVEVATTNPKDIERDDKGKLTKGEYTAEGDVIFRSKTFTVESLDYEVKDGKLETKALTKDGSVYIRAEKTNVLAADAEGKATGSINLNAKAVAVKSMNVDKEKLTDDKLAEGSTMTLVSEKMYVGAKSKDIKSKKLQAVSEEMGLFADKTFEAQQGDGKAVVQLDGGNANVGGSKTAVYGDTTINAKTEVKGELKAPKISGDSIEAKSAFKSPNISDGMAVGAGGGGGSLSAKLKSEDAPKE